MKIGAAIILCLLVLTVCALPAQTQSLVPEQRGEERPSCWRPEDLRLTQQQIEQIESIEHRYLREIRGLRNDLLNQKYQLRRLLSDPTSQATHIRSKQREISALENQMQDRILDYQLEVRQILTPEQFSLWVSRQRSPFGPRKHHRRGRGMKQK